MSGEESTTDIPPHLTGKCDRCGADLDENGSNMTIISSSSGDEAIVRCDECEERQRNHMERLHGED